jgi:hypothetical protein
MSCFVLKRTGFCGKPAPYQAITTPWMVGAFFRKGGSGGFLTISKADIQ